MTYERRVVTRRDDEAGSVPASSTNQVVERTRVSPSGGEMIRRVVVLIFGIIQVFIGLRIVLLLLNAREGNDLVAFILNVSQVFVTPFEGIFRTDALHSAGSILDIAAIAALVGWTILEAVVLWAVNVMRREPV
jgi:hypothetical protein